MPDGVDPLEWGERAGHRGPPRDARRAWTSHFDTWFSERVARRLGRHRGDPRRPARARASSTTHDGAVWLRTHRLRRRQGPRARQVATASPPTCCPTSPTTATSSPAASTCSSTCGAPTTTATCRGMKAAIAGARPRPRRARGRHRPARAADARRRAGPAVQAHRRHHRAATTCSTRSAPTPPASPTCCSRSTARRPFDLDVVTQRRSMDNPVFYVQMAHARIRSHRAGWPPSAGVERGAPRRRRPRRCSPTSASSRCCATLSRAARRGRAGAPPTGPRTRSPPGSASWPAPFHGFYHDCYVMGDGISPELTQARLWLVEAAGIGLAIGLDLLGVSARPSRCEPAGPASRARPRCPTRCRRSAPTGRLLDRRLRHARRWPPSSARRCSSTTRPTCAPAAARRSRRSATAVDYATKAFLCRAMARLAHEEGMHLDVATGGELPRGPAPPACPADRLVLHGNNKSLDELRRRPGRRRRPHRRRLASTSSTASSALRRRGRAACRRCCCGSPPASRPTPTSSCAPARTTRSSASGCAVGRGRARVDRAAALAARSSSSACTSTSAARCSWPSSSSRPSRCWPRSSRDYGLPELSIGGGLGVAYVEGEEAPTHHRVGRRPCARPCADAGHRRPGHRRAGPGHRRRRPASPSTRSGTIKDLPGIRTYVVGRRRHERQPPPGALRQRLRDVPAPRRRRPTGPARSRWSASTASRATCWCATARVPADLAVGDILGHAGHRRLRPLDGLQLQQGARARRWCSSRDGEARLVVRRETYDDLLASTSADPFTGPVHRSRSFGIVDRAVVDCRNDRVGGGAATAGDGAAGGGQPGGAGGSDRVVATGGARPPPVRPAPCPPCAIRTDRAWPIASSANHLAAAGGRATGRRGHPRPSSPSTS